MIVFFVYTIWIWPIVTIFGLAFGIKRLIEGNENYFIPLLISSVGLLLLVAPFLWMQMQ